MNVLKVLEHQLTQALIAAGTPEGNNAMVRTSARAQFGDYQANGIMPAAKKMGMNPRELAQQVVDKLELGGIIEKAEIAGPGFINLFHQRQLAGRRTGQLQQEPPCRR